MSTRTRHGSRWLVAAALAGALGFVCQLRCGRPATLATFNIEMFPMQGTDPVRVAELLVATRADVIAVQEIRDESAFERVVELAAESSGRDLRLVLSQCARAPGFLSPGLVYDSERLRLVEVREYPELRDDGGGQCSRTSLPGLMGVFEDGGGTPIAVMSVHFRPYPEHVEQRREQLGRALAILRGVEDQLGAHVVLMGDFNTTGFLGEPAREREAVLALVREAGYSLPTAELDCTEYWRPRGGDRYVPSLLDHIVLRGGDWQDPEVMGMCAALACQAADADAMHPDFRRASDHCPVRIHGDW